KQAHQTITAVSAKSHEFRLSGKDRKLRNALHRPRHDWRVICARKKNDISAIHRRPWLTKASRRQEKVLVQRPGGVNQNNVHIAPELQMLKPVVEKKNLDALRLEAFSFCKPVLG